MPRKRQHLVSEEIEVRKALLPTIKAHPRKLSEKWEVVYKGLTVRFSFYAGYRGGANLLAEWNGGTWHQKNESPQVLWSRVAFDAEVQKDKS